MQNSFLLTIQKILAKMLFIAFPLIIAFYYLLQSWNATFDIQTIAIQYQCLYFAIGVIGSMLFYALGFRFIPTYIILILGLYFLYKGVDQTAFSEFDGFLLSINFLIFSILFASGWLLGWGITRSKIFTFLFSIIIIIIYVILFAQSDVWNYQYNAQEILIILKQTIAVVILFCIIAIIFSEFIHNNTSNGWSFWSGILKRTGILSFIIILLLLFVNKKGFWNMEERLVKFTNENNSGGENGLLKKMPDTKDAQGNIQKGGYGNNDKLSMSSSNSKMNLLMFTAHIDNFFENTDIPNPLYLVSFYYTKYDPISETFERDEHIPFNNHYRPNVAQIPLYHVATDSTALQLSKNNDYIENVSFEIYNKNLDPSIFVAPTTAYFVQPIAIDPIFRKEYINAYRGQSVISKLNSAYFVYNSDEATILAFQENRSKVLRDYNNLKTLDSTFYQYYTSVPNTTLYKRIDSLAQNITKGKTLIIDKVNAIKSYFLSKDKNGKHIFKYTDNPGEPNLPGASKLEYFLFESKKGYCAYYATATLYMLRSLGIPSRVVGGFLTEDRSANKNRGWYWYYSDQAHAWVQVYFPGIGWIDFDTTIGNEDARESPQADGTPPLQPKKAHLASFGEFISIDTVLKIGKFKMKSLILFDKHIGIQPVKIDVDLSIATVIKDTATLGINYIEIGKPVTILSFAKILDKLKTTPINTVVKSLPLPLPVDEVHMMIDKPSNYLKNDTTAKDNLSNSTLIIIILIIVLFVFIAILFTPYWLFCYLKYKLKKSNTTNVIINAYKYVRWTNIIFHLGSFYNDFELFDRMDKQYQTNGKCFLNAFHQFKYGNRSADNTHAIINNANIHAYKIINSILPKHRWKYWLQIFKISKY